MKWRANSKVVLQHQIDKYYVISLAELTGSSDINTGADRDQLDCALKPVQALQEKIFLLTVPRQWFFCGSFMFLRFCFCCAFVRVCLLVPCGHLMGKD